MQAAGQTVTPFVGVWIETLQKSQENVNKSSHPSWVCGLKLLNVQIQQMLIRSHPSWVCGLKQ